MKVIIEFGDKRIGYTFKEGRQTLQWQDMTKEQQTRVLNAFANGFGLFNHFLKEE